MLKEANATELAKYKRWKLRREWHRIIQQIRSYPQSIYDHLRSRQLDATRDRWLRPLSGANDLGRKALIFLVYQPHGPGRSVIETCRHFRAHGYSILLVSNASLSPEARSDLQPLVWQIIERPNFGYDFGGYRDGILHLLDTIDELDRLTLLNDSIWYPIYKDDDLIKRLENLTADFAGPLLLEPGVGSEGPASRRRPFAGSFFLTFSGQVWRSKAFRDFWRNYQPTSNKYQTIRRGERGLSYQLLDSGFTIDTLLNRATFESCTEQFDQQTLRDSIQDLVTIDPRQKLLIQQILDRDASDPHWHQAALETLRAVTGKQNISSTAPVITLAMLGASWLKKSRDWQNLETLKLLAQKFRDGSLSRPEPWIEEEIEAVLQRAPSDIYA